jgi:hypothetical protein
MTAQDDSRGQLVDFGALYPAHDRDLRRFGAQRL